MSPPIYTPDGSEVSEIVLPDGSTASEVIGPDGNVVFEAGPDIPDSGVLRYTFDDAHTDGDTALDVWNDNDATVNGATTGVSGANVTYTTNEAYSFDGTDDNVSRSNGVLTEGESFTATCWVNPAVDYTSTSGNTARFFEPQGARVELQYGVTNGGDLELRLYDSQKYIAGGAKDLVAGNWYFICGRFDGSNMDIILNDGNIIGQNTGSWSKGSASGVYVASDNRPQQFFNGDVDDVRLYNKALSDTEISNLYNTGSI